MKLKPIFSVLLAASLALLSLDFYLHHEGSFLAFHLLAFLEVRSLRDFLVGFTLEGEKLLGWGSGDPEEGNGWPEEVEACPIPGGDVPVREMYEIFISASRPCLFRGDGERPAVMDLYLKYNASKVVNNIEMSHGRTRLPTISTPKEQVLCLRSQGTRVRLAILTPL